MKLELAVATTAILAIALAPRGARAEDCLDHPLGSACCEEGASTGCQQRPGTDCYDCDGTVVCGNGNQFASSGAGVGVIAGPGPDILAAFCYDDGEIAKIVTPIGCGDDEDCCACECCGGQVPIPPEGTPPPTSCTCTPGSNECQEECSPLT